MKCPWEIWWRDVVSGHRGGFTAALGRGVLGLGEPFYALAVGVRNWMYDCEVLKSRSAAVPVVCVGNLSAGGTGKTPVVRWLADELRRVGLRPAVLLRGYKSTAQHASDEQKLLARLLDDATLPAIPIVTSPDRVWGARLAVEKWQVDLVILDDGFQHRRLRRDFDLVLIDAGERLDGAHLLPRGLLREPVSSLRRASAVLLTHVEGVENDRLSVLERQIREHNAEAPIYRCRHRHRNDDLSGRRALAFCGIGNPRSFFQQLERNGVVLAGRRRFADHHPYTRRDVARLEEQATQVGADLLVTTEKDWVKLESLLPVGSARLPILAVQLNLEFDRDDDRRLLKQIQAVVKAVASQQPATGTAGAA